MRLSCPNCLTEYEVPDAAVAGRTRTLRCARCGHQWQNAIAGAAFSRLTPAAEEPGWTVIPAVTPAAPEPLAADDRNTQEAAAEMPEVLPSPAEVVAQTPLVTNQAGLIAPARPKVPYQPKAAAPVRKTTVGAKLFLAVVAFALIIGLLVGQRDAIIHAIPHTAKLYRAIGLLK